MSELTHEQITDGLVYLGFEHWAISGTDYDNMLLWESDQPKPTMTEIAAAAKQAQIQREQTEQARIADRAAAIEHAKSLGFTDAMISVMYPTLLEA